MAKKKKATPKKKQKKERSKWQILALGIAIGLGLFWVGDTQDFSSAIFKQNPLSSGPTSAIFSRYFPTTTPIIEKEGFFLAYNGQTRNAHWVYHKLTPNPVKEKTQRKECEFVEEQILPEHIRASRSDYKNSGYDRGHLCPAADTLTQKGMEDTFSLANIAPQAPAFNRGYWKKLENHVRDLTRQYRAVHVFSGPLYLSQKARDGKRFVHYEVIGKNSVAVPTHFFMLIFVELPTDKMLGKGYILPNRAIDSSTHLRQFSASVEEIESASGTVFTQILP